MRIRILALAAGAALLAACSGGSGTSTGSSGTTGTSGCSAANPSACTCTSDSDCTALGSNWICDQQQTKSCIFQCNTAADCVSDQAPDNVKSTCSTSTLGCTCDLDPTSQLSACNTKGCGTDTDCPGGFVCQSGQCVSSPVASVKQCSVFPEFVALNAGESYTFTVQAYQDDNKTTPLRITDADVTWTSTSSAITNTGATFTVSASAAATAPAASIKATIHSTVNCTANVQIYPANSAGVRVTVLDALAGVPLDNATVDLDSSSATTDSNGIATFASASTTTAHTISVFAQGFDYVTLYQTHATDILVPVTRNADANVGGVSGQVSNLFQANSKIHAGFVGMSMPGSITDISLTLLEGPSQPLCDQADRSQCMVSSFDISGINVPSGVMLGLNDQTFKGHYLALGAAGWCDDPTAVANGTCGNRGIWGLAGDIDLDKIAPLINQFQSSGGLSNLNLGGILGSLLPVLRNFNSLVQRDQPLTLGPADATASANTPTAANIKTANLDNTPNGNNAVKLGLAMKVKVPVLPHYPLSTSSTFADGAVVLGASDVPGRGLFPLGLTAGLDNDGTSTQPEHVDGHVSFYPDPNDKSNEVKDLVNLNMAPAHHGTESGSYRMAVLASSFSNLSAGLVGSGIVVNPGACQNNTGGICYGSTIDVSGQSFMNFPSGASFDYAGRTFTVGTFDPAAKLARLDFHDAADHRWFVYFDPSAVSTVTVPAPAGGFDDRTRSDDTTSGPRSSLLALNLELNNGATADDAYAFGGSAASLQKLDKYINRFIIKDYAPPSIKITAPTAGATITSSGSVSVTISGDDANSNKAVVCVTSSATALTTGDLSSAKCSPPISGDGTTTQSFGIPGGSPTGSVYLHAVLTNSAGSAVLDPSVEDAVQVTLN